MSRDESKGGFLVRWSDRKRTALAAEDPAEEPLPGVDDTDADVDADAKSDEEWLEELDLPAPESLEDGDDFSAFMKAAVPARLRNRALRRLWMTNPVLANLDELLDYGDDFTDAAMVIDNLQTVFEVGKGMPRPISEALARAEEEAAAKADAAPEGPAPEEPLPDTEADSAAEPVAETGTPASLEAGDGTIAAADPMPAQPLPRPRRMAFRFDEQG